MRAVFVDTSAFVATRDRRDRAHGPARDTLRRLVGEKARLLTSNYIFAETYTLLLLRLGWQEAMDWGRGVQATGTVELVRVDEDVEEDGWSILETHGDKSWSYVDATSFALMDRLGIDHAFAFDRHFVQRGLEVLPTMT